PLLIDLYDADLRTKVQPDGDDIIFKSSGLILSHEIEIFEQSYNETHAHLVAWVKADILSSTDTVITMYYGNPAAESQENSADLWNSNFKGVWHLSEDPTGTLYDSTNNSNHATGYNLQSDDQVDGQIDGSIDFDNVQDYLDCGDDSSLDVGSSDFSLSLWFNYDGVDMGVLAGKGAVLTARRYRISIESGPGMLMAEIDDNTAAKTVFSTSTYGDNLWHHVSMVRDGNNLRLFIDGVEDPNSPTDITGYGSLDELESFYINAFRSEVGGTLGYWSTANIDEVRVAKIALSPAWIATEYINQLNPNSFYSVGLEKQVGGDAGGEGYTFTTNSDTSVTVGVKLSLGVQTSAYSYADDFTLGTSFSIENGSLPIWTANVMVSPPAEMDAVSFKISYSEGEWWPFSVKTPSGIEKTFGTDWTCFEGYLIVGSTAINEYGMWKIQFLDRNHVLDIQLGPAGGPYSQTNEFIIGQDMQCNVQSSGTIGSTISLELTDPSGSVWYSGLTTFQGLRFSLPYHHRKQLTISHSDVAADLFNFPLLVDIFDTDLHTDVRTDGRDIAFTIGEETLSHEIEFFDKSFNSTHAHLVAWVKVPLLSGSADTVINMYYGNPLAPVVYDSGPVWDSGYLGVWHLSESGSGALDEYLDSSQYEHHGQGGEGNSSFVPTRVAGKIGSGQDFNNLDGYYDLIDCGDSPLWNINEYQITLEAWIQHDITPNTHVYGIMNHKGWYDGYSLFINYGGGSTLKPTFNLPGQTHQLRGANDVTGGVWHHIVATYDGSLMRIYVDGVQDPNVLVKTNSIWPSSSEQGFWIGHGDQPKDRIWSAEWDGQIDEVRISDVIRSADWIKTEFQNQNDPSSFFSVGTEETIGYSESSTITLDSSAPEGVWQATARYSDSTSNVSQRVGIFSRNFVVRHGASLSLTSPGDAV
ncbi:MAG: DUF2341 domain-containing protein, partial [Candidatus Hodarchaeota archaeon]